MTTLLSATGSTITNAMGASGLSALGTTAIVKNISVSRDSLGSVTVVGIVISNNDLGY